MASQVTADLLAALEMQAIPAMPEPPEAGEEAAVVQEFQLQAVSAEQAVMETLLRRPRMAQGDREAFLETLQELLAMLALREQPEMSAMLELVRQMAVLEIQEIRARRARTAIQETLAALVRQEMLQQLARLPISLVERLARLETPVQVAMQEPPETQVILADLEILGQMARLGTPERPAETVAEVAAEVCSLPPESVELPEQPAPVATPDQPEP